jgi:hypothetical protein
LNRSVRELEVSVIGRSSNERRALYNFARLQQDDKLGAAIGGGWNEAKLK